MNDSSQWSEQNPAKKIPKITTWKKNAPFKLPLAYPQFEIQSLIIFLTAIWIDYTTSLSDGFWFTIAQKLLSRNAYSISETYGVQLVPFVCKSSMFSSRHRGKTSLQVSQHYFSEGSRKTWRTENRTQFFPLIWGFFLRGGCPIFLWVVNSSILLQIICLKKIEEAKKYF